MYIPDKNSDREGAIRLLQATQEHLKDYNRAAAVLDRGGQYEDFARDIRKTIEDMVGAEGSYRPESLNGRLQQLKNAEQELKAGKISKDQYESFKNNLLSAAGGEAGIERQLKLQKQWLDGVKEFLQPQELKNYTKLVSGVKSIAPKLDTGDYYISGTDAETANIDIENEAGKSGQYKFSDASQLTGWAKQAYDKALVSGQDPKDFLNDIMKQAVSTNDVHKQTLSEVYNLLGKSGWKLGTPGSTTTGTGSTGGTGTAGGGSTGSTGTTGTTAGFTSKDKQAALDYINSLDLPADLKSAYSSMVENWDPNLRLNAENIIKTFQKIKSETIDPRFQGLYNLAIEGVKTAKATMDKERQVELETEAANAQADIESAQAGLESSGLTFSGQGKKLLGSQMAASIPFGGENIEGLLPQKKRLISTSSEARYKQNLKDLGLSAEEQLGSEKTSGLIAGYAPVGSVVGSLTEAKQAAEGATLGNVLNQQISNINQDESLNFNK